MVALRPPVLFVRLRSATRPGRFDRVPRAGYRQCIRRDIVGSRGGASCSPPPRRSVFLRYGCPSGAGQRYEPTERVGAGECSLRCHRFDARFSVAGSMLRPPDSDNAAYGPRRVIGAQPGFCPWPPTRGFADGVGAPTAGYSWRASSVGQLGYEVFDVPLSDVAGCLQDDAPVRRASRLRTTSGGDRACTSTLRSLTMNGPARTSPRPCVSPDMRAPLTLRLYPGAFSFQQQPTREESP
jgi:hypothetical protein